MKIALIRGKFLNKYEMQTFEELRKDFNLTAFGSLYPFHDSFSFPVIKLPSPMDISDFPYKMQIFNRVFTDAHYLVGLENKLKGFDIVHSTETYYRYTQQCLNAKKKEYVKKVIITVHDNIAHNNEGIWGRKTYKKRVREEVDHMIAISQKTKDAQIKEGMDSKKITVITHGINTRNFEVGKRMNELFMIQNKRINILFVGRIEEYKGIFDVLTAFQRLLATPLLRKYILHLYVVGAGTQVPIFNKTINTRGISQYVTRSESSYDNIFAYYNEADIFVAPSKSTNTWQEQFNIALLEAQACGLPIVTTDSGSILENVGNAAVTIQEGNVEELYKSLITLIIDPKKRIALSKKAHERAVKLHDTRIKAKQIAKVYRSLL